MKNKIKVAPQRMALNNLWRNWALAFGALIVPVLLAPVIPRMLVPVVALLLAYGLRCVSHSGFLTNSLGCMLIVRNSMVGLFWSGVIMTAIALLASRWAYGWWFAHLGVRDGMPFLPGIIIFPTMAVTTFVTLVRMGRSRYCRACRASLGLDSDDRRLGTLYHREARYQLGIMLMLMVAVSAIDWWYWLSYYINVNLSTPDYFFFLVMPVGLYVVSLVFIRARYAQTLAIMRSLEEGHDHHAPTTMLRFLILSGDRMLLRLNEQKHWDTPVSMTVPMTGDVDINRAEALFRDFTGLTELEIKYLYTNSGHSVVNRVEHFAVILPADMSEPDAKPLPAVMAGEWMTLEVIDRNMHAGQLATLLSNEIYRIFTVTMAWKTYDYEGRRLYPIKNYRPTFRLRDLRNWTVNYDDLHWLQIASSNEDKRFYRLRRIWRRLFGNYEV